MIKLSCLCYGLIIVRLLVEVRYAALRSHKKSQSTVKIHSGKRHN